MEQLVVEVDQPDQPRQRRDLPALDPERITAAVEPLVVQMGDLTDFRFKGVELGQHLQPVLGMHIEEVLLGLAEVPAFLGDLARDFQFTDIVDKSRKSRLLNLDGVHAEFACHQHGNESHIEAVLQQDIGVGAANKVEPERPFMLTEGEGGIADNLGCIGQPLIRFEVQRPESIAQLAHGLAKGFVSGAHGAAKGLFVKGGRARGNQLFQLIKVRPGIRDIAA